MLIDTIITLLGFGVPCLFLILVWWISTPTGFSTATLMFGILATLGMDHTIPMFGHEVVGGSTYFPAMFLSMAFCAKKFGIKEALSMVNCVSRGMALFAIAQFRWLFFALYAPEHTTHSVAEAMALGRNAVLMTGIVYLGGMTILSLRKMLEEYSVHVRLAIPVYVDILLMSPISILSVFSNENGQFTSTQSWNDTILWTLVTRLSVPFIVISTLYFFGNYKTAAALEEKDVKSER